MVSRKTILVVGVALVAFAPVVQASDVPAECYVNQDPTATSAGGFYYVRERHTDGQLYVQVWAETNGLAGLQTGYTFCGFGKPMIPPDAKMAEVSRTMPL